MRNGEDQQAWHQTTVSWGQLIVAGIALIVTVLGAVFLDRNGIEKRVTVLEQDHTYISRRVEQQENSVALWRAEITSKLDGLQRQMNEVILALAKHEARYNPPPPEGKK